MKNVLQALMVSCFLLLLLTVASSALAQDDPDGDAPNDPDGDEDGDDETDDDDDLDGDEDGDDETDDDDDLDSDEDGDATTDDDDDLDGDEDGDAPTDDDDDLDGDVDLDDDGESEGEHETVLIPVERCKRECACTGAADGSAALWVVGMLTLFAWLLRRRVRLT